MGQLAEKSLPDGRSVYQPRFCLLTSVFKGTYSGFVIALNPGDIPRRLERGCGSVRRVEASVELSAQLVRGCSHWDTTSGAFAARVEPKVRGINPVNWCQQLVSRVKDAIYDG